MNQNLLVVLSILLVLISITYFRYFSISDEKKLIIDIVEKNSNVKFIHKKIIDMNKPTYSENENIIIINDDEMFNDIIKSGELGFAESYINGKWDAYDLEKLLLELYENFESIKKQLLSNNVNLFFVYISSQLKSLFKKGNSVSSIKDNISHHYDIGNDLYEKMLGKHMQYTCAYFNDENMTLDEAQYAKMELIAKKLDLRPGMKVMDIGCGFGTMANHLATKYDINVIGVTLSQEQINYYNKNFLNEKVTIIYKDYRDYNIPIGEDKFDRIYSVGMFEHVGRNRYHEYYDKCFDLLKDDGIMFIHTIGTNMRQWNYNSFINKYIFPEGELPHLSHMFEKYFDKWHLENVQNIGLSYAKTLRNWNKNIGNWEGLNNYNNKFRRMWHFYLIGCAANFQYKEICLYQFVFTKIKNKRPDDCTYIMK